MKGNKSTSVNGSTLFFASAKNLEKPFKQIALELNEVVEEDLPEREFVVSGSSLLWLFRSYAMGEDPDFVATDIDVYVESEEEYESFVRAFTRQEGTEYIEHSARSVKFGLRGHVYDFVSFRHGSLFEIITSHDLSPCGIGATVRNGRVRMLAVTEEFVLTMNDGKMRAQNDFEDADPLSVARTIDRVFKYNARGYEPTFDLIQNVMDRIYSADPSEKSEFAEKIMHKSKPTPGSV